MSSSTIIIDGFLNYTCTEDIMKQFLIANYAVVLLLLVSSLSGCTSDEDAEGYDGPINLVVYYDSTSGLITENTQGGTQISSEDYSIEFDFSNSSSDKSSISSFFANAGDGSSDIVVDAADSAQISITWATHGLFNVTLGAIDENDNTHSIEIKVRIEKRSWHNQTNTNNPLDNQINAAPDNDGPNPKSIIIKSTVENPNGPFNTGSSVMVSWSVSDGSGEEIASGNAQIGNGQSETWEYVVLDVMPETYTLSISRDQGNDSLDIQNDIHITYDAAESPSNPFDEI